MTGRIITDLGQNDITKNRLQQKCAEHGCPIRTIIFYVQLTMKLG